MTFDEFLRLFEEMCHAFNQDFKEGQAIVYFKYLKAFQKEAFAYAVDEAILHLKYPRMPLPAELIDSMKDYKEPIPAERQLNAFVEEPLDPNIAKERLKIIREAMSKIGTQAKEAISDEK